MEAKPGGWQRKTAAAIILIWVLSVGVAAAAAAAAAAVSAMFIMGDSSVDCGENTLFYPLLHRNLSLIPCQGSSQTSLLPYLLAKKMELPNLPLPFYNQNGSIEQLTSGLNYGSAGATIMNIDSQSHQCLTQQLRQVFETFQLLELHLGQDSAQAFVNSSLFYLSFGKDDYIDIFLAENSTATSTTRSRGFAEVLVHQVVMVARRLYEGNVRKIVCMGVLPVGCAPGNVWGVNGDQKNGSRVVNGCVAEVNELVLEYNKMLGDAIMELQRELVDAEMVFCDVYLGFMEILANPAKYGFEDTENACCGLGIHGVAVGCLSEEMACNLSSSPHVWWDLYNPTQRVNSVLADSAWSDDDGDQSAATSSICYPVAVKGLVDASLLPRTVSPESSG